MFVRRAAKEQTSAQAVGQISVSTGGSVSVSAKAYCVCVGSYQIHRLVLAVTQVPGQPLVLAGGQQVGRGTAAAGGQRCGQQQDGLGVWGQGGGCLLYTSRCV